MEKIVELKNVTKTYLAGEKEFNALNNINLTINKGELVVILGPSGAGKSTLLNLIGGMDTSTKGEIIINGENISKYSENKLSEYRAKNIGFIFQFYNILPTLTVLENVELIKDIINSNVNPKDAIKAVGLENHINKFPNQLSGGEQQRVSIARAIAKNPKLLLCDEPTGALDSKTSKEILILLEEINKKYGTTMMIVTHNDAIKDMVHKVIKIKDGEIYKEYENKTRILAADLEW